MKSCKTTTFEVTQYNLRPHNVKTSAEEIQLLVSSVLDIPAYLLRSQCRKREIVTGRYICYFLMREYLELTLEKIALILDRKKGDHSVVIYGLKVHKALVESRNDYSKGFNKVMKAFVALQKSKEVDKQNTYLG